MEVSYDPQTERWYPTSAVPVRPLTLGGAGWPVSRPGMAGVYVHAHWCHSSWAGFVFGTQRKSQHLAGPGVGRRIDAHGLSLFQRWLLPGGSALQGGQKRPIHSLSLCLSLGRDRATHPCLPGAF